MTTPLPPWLTSPPFTGAVASDEVLANVSRNWVCLFAVRAKLTEGDCLRIIALELAGDKRPEFIGRVKAWYDRLRSKRENLELWKLHPGAGVRIKSKRKAS